MSPQIQKFRVDFIKPRGGRVSFAAGYRTDGTNRCQAWEHKKETGTFLTVVIKRTFEGARLETEFNIKGFGFAAKQTYFDWPTGNLDDSASGCDSGPCRVTQISLGGQRVGRSTFGRGRQRLRFQSKPKVVRPTSMREL